MNKKITLTNSQINRQVKVIDNNNAKIDKLIEEIFGGKYMIYKGMDIGTSSLIVAENDNDGNVTVKKERDAFFSMEASDTVIDIIDNVGASYIFNKDTNEIYIIGEDALTFANLFAKEARRPMRNGVLSNIDAQAMPMLKALIKGLVGDAPDGGAILKYSVPADPVNGSFDIVYHQNILNNIFNELGYDASPINEGLCVVYSELSDEKFTGIGLSFGGGMVNVAITNLGVPIGTFSIIGSGDQIDEKVAQVKSGFGWTASKVTKKKESGINIMEPKDEIEETIAIYYKHMLQYIAKTLKTTLIERNVANFPDDIVLAIAGGTSLVGGFMDAFKIALDDAKLPVGIKELRHAKQPLYSVAYGAHMAAGMEAKKKERNNS